MKSAALDVRKNECSKIECWKLEELLYMHTMITFFDLTNQLRISLVQQLVTPERTVLSTVQRKIYNFCVLMSYQTQSNFTKLATIF